MTDAELGAIETSITAHRRQLTLRELIADWFTLRIGPLGPKELDHAVKRALESIVQGLS